MPSLFDDLKKEFGKHAEVFGEKINEFSETAKGQFEIINLKKDRYLLLKELGECVFQLAEKKQTAMENDDRVKGLVAQIRSLNEKIDLLEKNNSSNKSKAEP